MMNSETFESRFTQTVKATAASDRDAWEAFGAEVAMTLRNDADLILYSREEALTDWKSLTAYSHAVAHARINDEVLEYMKKHLSNLLRTIPAEGIPHFIRGAAERVSIMRKVDATLDAKWL